MKKYLRFISLMVLLIIVVFFLISCGGSKSPSEVVKTAYMKANKGEYEQANKYLIESANALLGASNLRAGWDSSTRDGTIKEIEIINETINNEKAEVKFKIDFEGGKTTIETIPLLKKDGKWKISG